MDDNSGNIDEHLSRAYRNTRYWVQSPEMEIKIGRKNEELDVFLFDNHCWQWAFISAFNPGSKVVPVVENEQNHQKLRKKINSLKFRFCEGLGIPAKDEDWQPEKNFLILDISKPQAIALAQEFGQLAILFGAFEGEAELVWVLDFMTLLNRNISMPAQLTVRANNLIIHPNRIITDIKFIQIKV